MPTDEEPSASRPLEFLGQSLVAAIDNVSLHEQALDDIMFGHFRGEPQVARVARLADEPSFLALIQSLRFKEPRLLEDEKDQLGPERIEVFRRLHDKYYPLLEDVFDAAIEGKLYGVHNTWTAVTSQPLYHPDDEQIFMRLRIIAGIDTTYQSLDRVDDFLRLGVIILHRCQQALRYVAAQRLKLTDEQLEGLSKAVQRAEAVTTELKDLLPPLQQEPAEKPASQLKPP